MTFSIRPRILSAGIIILTIGTVISLPFISSRIRAEKSSNVIEIGMDCEDIRYLTVKSGTSELQLLIELKNAGVSSVVIPEVTLSEAVLRGIIGIESIPGGLRLQTHDRYFYRSLLEMLPGRYGVQVIAKGDQHGIYLVEVPFSEGFRSIPWNGESPLGYDQELISVAAKAGMEIVLRPGNTRGSSWMPDIRADSYIFDAEETPGFPGNEHSFWQAISAHRKRGIYIEFSRVRGEERMAKSMMRAMVNGHTITPKELDKGIPMERALSRWYRAVDERGIRFLFVHAIQGKGLAENLNYLQSLSNVLKKKGYFLGRADPPPYPVSSRLPLRMILIALTALLVPLIAMAAGQTMRTPLGGYIAVNVIALAGGCILAACFYDVRFMQRLMIMPGIKLFLLVPMAVVAISLYHDIKLNELIKAPITAGHAALAACIIIAAYILIVRSGNDVPAWLRPESGLREWMESVLPVRPRTKEFLIAQPLLFAGLASRRKLLILAGSLAPVSILNTFFHAHTPFIISFERSVIGMVAGLILGYILLKAMKNISNFKLQIE